MSGVRKTAALALASLVAISGWALGSSRNAAAAEADAQASAERTIYVAGHGKGHGVGVCMTGAWYMASTYGFNYRDIINFYYTGLDPDFGTYPNPSDPTVRIGVYGGAPGDQIHITCSGPFLVRVATDDGQLFDWDNLNNGNVGVKYVGGKYYIYLNNNTNPDLVTRYPVWVFPKSEDSYPLGVYEMGYSFREWMEVQYGGASGKLWAVNQINVEKYIWGQEEEPSSSPTEFLRMFTILYRTYAMNHKLHPKYGGDGFDLSANADSQVYRGWNAESPQIKAAQAATNGQVLTYQGEPIVAAYSSNCGGHTESYNWAWGGSGGYNPYPYLVGVPDPYCAGTKDHDWSRTYSFSDFQNVLNSDSRTAVGNLASAYVSVHTPSGRAHEVTVTGSGGTKKIIGDTFADILGLQTPFFDLFDSSISTEVGTFAEGYTGSGFNEYLTLLNPDTANTAHLMVDYLFGDGTDLVKGYAVPPSTRATINVNGEVGANKEVSMHILGDRKVYAERPMYFSYKGWTGGSNVAGVSAPQQAWYFAEGYTGAGFEEYLTLANPQASSTHVDITYMFPDGTTQPQALDLGPHSRKTVYVNDAVGAGREVSMKIIAGQPVVAERPMYFNYKGWNGGHDAAGLAGQPATRFYFAEGTTRPGFDEYLTLANPGDQPAEVTVGYLFNGANPQDQPVTVQPHSRYTIMVNAVVGPNRDVSMVVDSDQPIVAERPMYFNYGGWCTDGTVALGATGSSANLMFAEGTTRAGFLEYLCLANPNDSDASVTLTYTFADGTTKPVTYRVAANSRSTVYVNAEIAAERDVSVVLTSDQPVVAERPMYFAYGGWTGGHDAFGVAP